MDWFVKAFIKASVCWLAAGITLGVAMAVFPPWTLYRTAHLHINLLGFVAMMIFGVAYHVIPRFAGRPLPSRRAAGVHWGLANGGLALLVAGFFVRVGSPAAGSAMVAAGGALAAVGGYIFAWSIFRTIDAAPMALGPVAVPAASAGEPVSLHRRPG